MKQTVTTYVQKQYQVPEAVGLHITDVSRVGDTCYQKITLDGSSGNRRTVVYLTPDQKYVTAALMDLSVDPRAATLKLEHETMMTLLAGTPPSRGPVDAPVTLVEFADFQCPYCARLVGVLSGLTAEEAGKIRVVFRQLPLRVHPWAREAAMIGVCVDSRDHGAFWKLYDFIYSRQTSFVGADVKPRLLQFIKDDLQLNPDAINTCLDQHQYEQTLTRDEELAKHFEVGMTPTVFVNGRRFFGSFAELKVAIQAALASAQPKSESRATPREVTEKRQ
jgi:protein-disulfide isomerase